MADKFLMVIRDLVSPKEDYKFVDYFKNRAATAVPLAPVADRFIALILDFLILSPVVSFFVATFLRDLKTVLIVSSESDSAMIIWVFFVLSIVALSSFLQSLFLYFWQATPGQKFMHLAVVSYPQWMNETERLTYAQCLVRSIGWWGSVFLGAIPFLDIAGHPLRRAIHERMSDTIVITKKRGLIDAPLAIETRYISSALWVFYGFLFVVGMTFMAKTYKAALLEGLSGDGVTSQAFCPQISHDKYKDQQKRLDLAIALYLAEEADNACIYTEAQRALWSSDGDEKALAELAMAMVSEDEEDITQYHEKTCITSASSEACEISKYLRDEKNPERALFVDRSELSLVSSRFLLLNHSVAIHDFKAAKQWIHSLERETLLSAAVEKNRVKVAWILNAQLQDKKARSPASAEEKEILKEFKERYQIK
ncbi:MAG: RDD family protein [Bdellovibrionaceae bacterium]|nr:RDD family protein [Pseudobdellovibrionaceae bacterium]